MDNEAWWYSDGIYLWTVSGTGKCLKIKELIFGKVVSSVFLTIFFIRSTQDGRCHSGTIGAKIESYVNVTSGDLEALKIAIAQKGPVAVGIDASHRSFAFYSFGVYYEPQCGTS